MHSTMAALPPDWLSATRPLRIPLDAQRWLSLEDAADGAQLLTLFTVCPWNLPEAAEQALAAVNLRERAGPVIAVGVWRDALVLSLRLNPALPAPAALDEGAYALLGFVEQYLRRY